MSENRIKALRRKKGLSQKQLAELVETSQQQIQRIETGNQAIRFDLALRVCTALEMPMQTVFPQTRQAITQYRRKGKALNKILDDPEFEEKMEKAGLDMDFRQWRFYYRLRGGVEGVWPVSSQEQTRLWHAVQRGDESPFVVFDSEEARIVLNLNHLVYCHFLFDSPNVVRTEKENEEDENRFGPVTVYLADSPEPLHFDVDPDPPRQEPAEDEGQFRFLEIDAMLILEEDENEVLHFMDADGETAFFRARDVAMIVIPLPIVVPELLDEDEGTE